MGLGSLSLFNIYDFNPAAILQYSGTISSQQTLLCTVNDIGQTQSFRSIFYFFYFFAFASSLSLAHYHAVIDITKQPSASKNKAKNVPLKHTLLQELLTMVIFLYHMLSCHHLCYFVSFQSLWVAVPFWFCPLRKNIQNREIIITYLGITAVGISSRTTRNLIQLLSQKELYM